jgi:uncharacterized protein YjiS (DUF1127 family)
MRLWLRRLVGRVAGFWRRRALEAELHTLDERSLHDIGIARGDIPAIVSGDYAHDESRRQRGTRICGLAHEHGRRSIHPDDARRTQAGRAEASSSARQPREFAESWIEAWNRRDLDAVLAHFSDEFEFSSPLIRQIAGEPSGKLVGKAAVRAYWRTALSRLPELHFELVQVLAGVDSLTILYRGQRGLGAEVFQLGANGLAVRGDAQYAA